MSVFANEADGVTLERRVLVPLTVEDLAAAFCEMDDDQQARFFVEVARIVATWEPVARSMQPMLIGKHLGECDCSTDEARELVRDIASGIAAGECEAGTLARETRGAVSERDEAMEAIAVEADRAITKALRENPPERGGDPGPYRDAIYAAIKAALELAWRVESDGDAEIMLSEARRRIAEAKAEGQAEVEQWRKAWKGHDDRITELEAERGKLVLRIEALVESCDMACETPPERCECAGCLYARDVNAKEQGT